ncbi:hypothetical protein V6N13_147994 [Hibiscus sabdariffa]
MVCFKCGTYGHVTERCPLTQVNAGDTTVQTSPMACRKVIPSEPFGPWMLVERRQRRQNKPAVPIETHVATTPPQGSRFNPIFMEDNVVDEFGHHPIPPIDLSNAKLLDPTPILPKEEPIPPSPAPPLATNDKTVRTKSKGKIPLSVRKPPAVVLAPKNTNIMPRKSGMSLPSTSRLLKGRHVTKILDPVKHGAMEVSHASAPIVIAKSPAKHGAPTSSAIVTSQGTFVVDTEGCSHRNFILVTREYLRDHRPDICVFVETRISRRKADQTIASLGFSNSFRVEARGFSGWTWLCWFGHVAVDILSYHFQFIHCRLSDGFGYFLTTLVYASLNSARIAKLVRPLLLILHFKIWFLTVGFTIWIMWDHNSRGIEHKDFRRLIVENWNSSQPLSDVIRSFTLAASSWNRDVFGSIGRNKKILKARLRGVQRCLDQKRTRNLLKLEQKLLTELEVLLDLEEQLWK